MMDKTVKKLAATIKLWNESRFDLFHISDFDERKECHGIVRFYHQDTSNNAKYATKCVRVSSSATTVDVIEVLAEKFRSDMRMLSTPFYGLYEVHMDGESRKLKDAEYPLLVQLDWIKDDREGRFLLLHEENVKSVNIAGKGLYEESEDTIKGFKLTRNLTKKEKKLQKKRDKLAPKVSEHEVLSTQNKASAAKQLYNQVPESTFTRTVSNPEAVMKKRREQKLQKRGAKALKIYADTLNPEIPYKTLLLLPGDTTETVIRDTLNKYGFVHEVPSIYHLIQIVLPPGSKPEECFDGGWGKETILRNNDLPLTIFDQWQPHQGTLMFQLRKKVMPHSKSLGDITDNDAKKQQLSSDVKSLQKENVNEKELPKLVELIRNKVVVHQIQPNVSEVASKSCFGKSPFLWNADSNAEIICVVTNMDGIVTITPHNEENQIYVNGKPIDETTVLEQNNIVQIGKKMLVFCEVGYKYVENAAHAKLDKFSKMHSQPTLNISEMHHPVVEGHRCNPVSPVSKKIYHNLEVENNSSLNHANPGRRLTSNDVISTHKVNMQSINTNRISSGTLQDRQLPISLLLQGSTMENFFTTVLETNGHNLHFKLSTAYVVYLATRWIQRNFPDQTYMYLNSVAHKINIIIQECTSSVTELAFWMANVSEMLNFIRQDMDLCMSTNRAQDELAKIVQLSFRHIVQCMQRNLFALMSAFLSQSDGDLPGGIVDVDLKQQRDHADGPTMYDILRMLSSAMSLLRKCRVNAALTIQLFSQLFHFINMWLFNKLVSNEVESKVLCSKKWGICIRARLAIIEAWAEKQGLELAADCHLARITQATHLLQAPKYSSDDIAAISGTCFKLNSLQLRALLMNYSAEEQESVISLEMIEKVVTVAESSADELTRSDGRSIQLMEDPDLQLPFLLPEDGYSCDVVHGAPSGLIDFMDSLSQKGLCSYVVETNSNGLWTTFFSSHEMKRISMHKNDSNVNSSHNTDVIRVPINKKNGGMGLSIVAARDGRIQAGDQLISVDGHSLVGVDQERAANLMTKTGPTAVLEVAKQGAIYHGLAMILNHPLPKNHSQPAFDENHTELVPQNNQKNNSLLENLHRDETTMENKTGSPKQVSSTHKGGQSMEFKEITKKEKLSSSGINRQSTSADVVCVSLDNPNYSSLIILPQNESKQTNELQSENNLEKQPLLKKKSEHLDLNQKQSKKDLRIKKSMNVQKNESKKFSTLPRHFKSTTAQDRMERERQEKTVQDELNSLRDEEIQQLTDRLELLTSFERDRLETLVQEKEFHSKIQKEKMKFCDEDIIVEDFNDIPDRPDKDRFLQQDDQALGDGEKHHTASNKIKNNTKLVTDKFPVSRLQQEKVDGSHSLSPSVSSTEISASNGKPKFHSIVAKGEPLTREKRSYSTSKSSHGDRIASPKELNTTQRMRNSKLRSFEQRRPMGKYPRPVSDGYFLSSMIDQANDHDNQTNGSHEQTGYLVSSASGVIGSQEIYNDPYHKKQETKNRNAQNRRKETDPSTLTFRDRQRLFQRGGSSPISKPKSSKTLLQIEKKLGDTT